MDNPCDNCALRFNCPNDDPEEPDYCPWFIQELLRGS